MKETRKTIHDRVWDEESKDYVWKEVEIVRYRHDEEDRTLAVLDFLKKEQSVAELVEKHHISNEQTLFSWVGRYLSQNEVVSLQEQTDEDMAKTSKDDQIRELKAQLKQARKEAELEKLRAHALDTMINLAEKTFNIPIRKKSGTKQ